jgi:hypothetical protein
VRRLAQNVGRPSTWHDGLGSPGAVHHLAFHVKDAAPIIEGLASLGMQVVQTGDYRGGRYTYVDSTARLGVALELLEDRPAGA